MEFKHKPVLLNEVIEELNIKENGIYVDGTLGGAGHSIEILKHLSPKGRLIGIDRDFDALNAAKDRLKSYSNVTYVHGNHDNITSILHSNNINQVDGILLDLGVSSYQLDEASRGFSYMSNAKLDMRMDTSQELTAWTIVNNYPEEKLADIIWKYGEERFSKNIAKNICIARKNKTIETTGELADIIKKSIPESKSHSGHPAKKTFQAIRIEVNGEILYLKNTIEDCIKLLNDHGRLVVITFHSLEDRAVKEAMKEMEGKCSCPKDLPYCICGYVSFGKVITKKPILPSEEEQEENSRSKSAKLRVFERIYKNSNNNLKANENK